MVVAQTDGALRTPEFLPASKRVLGHPPERGGDTEGEGEFKLRSNQGRTKDKAMADKQSFMTGAHWGVFRVQVENGKAVGAEPLASDPNPPPLIESAIAANHHDGSRVLRPMVRQGWLENGPQSAGARTGAGRGGEPFVPVSWDKAVELVATELTRIRDR